MFCNNQKGFSLVGVTVAAALMGGLALMMMRIMDNINSGKIFMEAMADEDDLRSSLKILLENSKHCSISLRGKTFKKKEIDFDNLPISRSTSNFNSSSEGLDIDLWYSDMGGVNKTRKRFNGADYPGSRDLSQFGRIKIKTIKLVMNNGNGPCSGNYCDNESSDLGQIAILYEKPIRLGKMREQKLVFDINVKMQTSSAVSTIDSCALKLAGEEEKKEYEYPQQCTVGFRYVTHGGSIRNDMTMPLSKPGFYGIKMLGDSDVDDDNYLHLKANCPTSGGNEFDKYLRDKCSIAIGQRDTSSNSSLSNASPEHYSKRRFNSVSSWENFRFKGDVNTDDRIYFKMFCSSGYSDQNLVNWVQSTCRFCLAQTDDDSDGNVRNVGCSPIQTSGYSPTNWAQVKVVGDADTRDTFFFGFFCNNHYFPDVIASDVIK